jgi:hypothetical protein
MERWQQLEVRGQFHAAAALPCQKSLMPFGQEGVWVLELLWMRWRGGRSFPFWDSHSDPFDLQHVVSCHIQCANLAHVSLTNHLLYLNPGQLRTLLQLKPVGILMINLFLT